MTDVVGALRATISRDRIWRFVAVGGFGALCDYAVLIALVELWDVTLELAKIAGAEVSIVVMFLINERWTFARWGKTSPTALLRRLLTSNLVRIGGIVVAVVVLSVLVRGFGVSYLIANAVGIAAGFVVNYVAENLLTWRVHR